MPTDARFLQNYPCFRGLPEEKLKSIAQFANAVCYLPGHTLFNEGEPGKYLYFLVKGEEVDVLLLRELMQQDCALGFMIQKKYHQRVDGAYFGSAPEISFEIAPNLSNKE
ncbi:MAG: cyclic nucleotide-binding domain-containing protein [Chloroflexota bacterium]